MSQNLLNGQEEMTGIILAGGRGARMNGEDKGLIALSGQPLFEHVLMRLQPQVTKVCISANRHFDRYHQSGCEVFPDTFRDFAGPLAGMLAALQRIETTWAVFASCDTPFIPADMAAQLWQGKQQAKIAWVQSDGRHHPTHALVHQSVAPLLDNYLHRGDRKLMVFLQEAGGVAVTFDNPQAFININTPEELASFQETPE